MTKPNVYSCGSFNEILVTKVALQVVNTSQLVVETHPIVYGRDTHLVETHPIVETHPTVCDSLC